MDKSGSRQEPPQANATIPGHLRKWAANGGGNSVHFKARCLDPFMSAKTIFRALLIATIISMAADIVTYHFQRNSLPVELREYLRSRSEQVLLHDYAVFSVGTAAYAIFFVMSFVGLFFFRRSARLLFCAFILVGLFMPLADFGADVETGWMELWSGCSNILLGVILCLAFTPPIRDQFVKGA